MTQSHSIEGKFTVSAPTRVDLAGGTLDLWPLYCFTGGAKTINLALDLFAQVRFEVSRSDVFSMEVTAPDLATQKCLRPLSMAECRNLEPLLQYPVFVLSQYLQSRKDLPPLRIAVEWSAQAPVGSGLGGSSTFGVALLRGIGRVFNDYTEVDWEWRLLHTIKDIEAAFLQTPTGTQDYLAALFGGLNSFESRSGSITRTSYRTPVFDALSDRLLVLFSGEQHHSGKSNWELYRAAVEKDAAVFQGLVEIREIAESLDTQLNQTQPDWRSVGTLLNAEWKVRRDLFKVSTPRLDQILASLKTKGVLGAKVCGAAAGGSLLVLAEPDRVDGLAQDIQREGIQVLKTKPVLRGVTLS